MNVALVEHSSGRGGTSKYVYQLARLIDKERFRLFVYAGREDGWYEKLQKEVKGVSFCPVGRRNRKRRRQGGRLSGYLYRILELASLFPEIVSHLIRFRKHGIHLVHTNNNIYVQLPAIVAARILRIPVICHIHEQTPLTWIERKAARYVTRFNVLTEEAKEIFATVIPAAKISVIPNGLVLEDYPAMNTGGDAARHRKPAVGVVGRIVEWKGQETLIRAVPEVLDRFGETRFYIIGEDPSGDHAYRDRLMRLARELEVERHVIFTGWVDDPRPLVRDLDICVCTSTEPEPFGFVVLESMIQGVATISTAHGGPLRIIEDGESGMLYPPGDHRALAGKIVRLLEDPSLRTRLAGNGKAIVMSRFSMQETVRRVEQGYMELLCVGT